MARLIALTVLGAAAVGFATIVAVEQPLIAFGLVAALTLAVISYKSPSAGVAAWVALTAVTPHWTPLSAGGLTLRPLTLIGIPVVLGLLLSRRRARGRMSAIDVTLAAGVVSVAVLAVLADYPTFLVTNLVLISVLGYTIGRLADPDAAQRAFAVVMVFVAAWGLLEFATGIYVFSTWFPDTGTMAAIQPRGAFLRSEAGMGHSIAYGASLVMAIPMAQKLRRNSVLAQVILIAGVIVSFARGPMLALVLTLTLAFLFLARGARRGWLSVILVTAGIAVGVALNSLYSGDTADVVASSSTVRGNQWTTLLGQINFFGSAGDFVVLPSGYLQVAGVGVIDSAPLRLAANYGWVVAVLLLSPMLAGVAAIFRHRLTSVIAVVGQIPVLLVTSLITQWEACIYFAAGIMITEVLRAKAEGAVFNGRPLRLTSQTGAPARA